MHAKPLKHFRLTLIPQADLELFDSLDLVRSNRVWSSVSRWFARTVGSVIVAVIRLASNLDSA